MLLLALVNDNFTDEGSQHLLRQPLNTYILPDNIKEFLLVTDNQFCGNVILAAALHFIFMRSNVSVVNVSSAVIVLTCLSSNTQYHRMSRKPRIKFFLYCNFTLAFVRESVYNNIINYLVVSV